MLISGGAGCCHVSPSPPVASGALSDRSFKVYSMKLFYSPSMKHKSITDDFETMHLAEKDMIPVGLEEESAAVDPSQLDQTEKQPSSRRSSASSGSSASSHRARHKAGHASYAELISRAIYSCAENQMTLAQIYDWMVDNVPSLQGTRTLHSSKGWKNAVRHTLSINPRFKRIPRQGRPGVWTVDEGFKGGGAGGRPVAFPPLSPPSSDPGSSMSPPVSASRCDFLDFEGFRLFPACNNGSWVVPYQPHQDLSPPATPGVLNASAAPPCGDYQTSQSLWVLDNEGRQVYVTFPPGPLRLCSKVQQLRTNKCDAFTQTDNQICAAAMSKNLTASTYSNSVGRNFDPDQCIVRKVQNVDKHADLVRSLPRDEAAKIDLSSCSSSAPSNCALPADLQDISLDNTIDWGSCLWTNAVSISNGGNATTTTTSSSLGWSLDDKFTFIGI